MAEKDLDRNVLIVAQGHSHSSLYHKQLMADQVHWINGSVPENLSGISAKIRYRQADQICKITELSVNKCTVRFDKPQFAITPGQSIVFYHGNECLGGAVIENRSFH